MLKQIEYFQAVVRTNSFSAAAEECFISQSAVSQQIKAMEKELGFDLFIRNNKRIRLTPAGEYFYKKSVVLVSDYDRLCRESARIARNDSDIIKIGYLASYSGEEMRLALEQFAKTYPNVTIRLMCGCHEEDKALACTPAEELLSLELLNPQNIKDSLHAYQLAKRCNEKRVMYEAVRWGKKKARINSISPGIIVTPLAIDEFNGKRGDFYKNMFKKSPAGRPGTADEVANVAELLMSGRGEFITGSDFLIDGGATATYFYGDL